MARPVSILEITESERTELQRRLNSPTTAQRDSLRAAIVLRRGEGIKQEQVAEHSASARPVSTSGPSASSVRDWKVWRTEKDEDDRPRFPRTRWSK